MVYLSSIFKFFRPPKQNDDLTISKAKLDAGEPLRIVSASDADAEFLVTSYSRATSEGTVAQTSDVIRFIEQCLSVSKREKKHGPHQHPFIAGQPPTRPVDDIFIIKVDEISIGVLWLRDHNDRNIAPESFGELIFLWFRPELRGFKCWPHVDRFAKSWVQEKKKTCLVGRCLRPSRRMAELFERSGYQLEGMSPKGMSVHIWRPARKAKRWA
ncbi:MULTISPECIES: hypothetical protein [unclassified Janthinobacterium]|uniref:hypothetical protein n=1 Tax=unclassified Janthinobacterium TaxID=2610881 RepID=UPI00160BB0CF|nr:MULTISPECIES: hypothetical protein [unclassified Janthinobacterium]MBB5369792.1 hypothetical protein [Janthinobacterium sp. K2C7]MBB5382598.1 hypothetical protein [Janthinobacterium sp. K2Li3]MBB5384583.1 hypothetical protein [Janthinobacterium sp. K2E3]